MSSSNSNSSSPKPNTDGDTTDSDKTMLAGQIVLTIDDSYSESSSDIEYLGTQSVKHRRRASQRKRVRIPSQSSSDAADAAQPPRSHSKRVRSQSNASSVSSMLTNRRSSGETSSSATSEVPTSEESPPANEDEEVVIQIMNENTSSDTESDTPIVTDCYKYEPPMLKTVKRRIIDGVVTLKVLQWRPIKPEIIDLTQSDNDDSQRATPMVQYEQNVGETSMQQKVNDSQQVKEGILPKPEAIPDDEDGQRYVRRRIKIKNASWETASEDEEERVFGDVANWEGSNLMTEHEENTGECSSKQNVDDNQPKVKEDTLPEPASESDDDDGPQYGGLNIKNSIWHAENEMKDKDEGKRAFVDAGGLEETEPENVGESSTMPESVDEQPEVKEDILPQTELISVEEEELRYEHPELNIKNCFWDTEMETEYDESVFGDKYDEDAEMAKYIQFADSADEHRIGTEIKYEENVGESSISQETVDDQPEMKKDILAKPKLVSDDEDWPRYVSTAIKIKNAFWHTENVMEDKDEGKRAFVDAGDLEEAEPMLKYEESVGQSSTMQEPVDEQPELKEDILPQTDLISVEEEELRYEHPELNIKNSCWDTEMETEYDESVFGDKYDEDGEMAKYIQFAASASKDRNDTANESNINERDETNGEDGDCDFGEILEKYMSDMAATFIPDSTRDPDPLPIHQSDIPGPEPKDDDDVMTLEQVPPHVLDKIIKRDEE